MSEDALRAAGAKLVTQLDFPAGWVSVGLGEGELIVYMHRLIKHMPIPLEVDSFPVRAEYIGKVKPA